MKKIKRKSDEEVTIVPEVKADEFFLKYKKYTTIYSVSGIILFILALADQRFPPLSFILIAYAIVGIILIIHSKGTIRFYAEKKSGNLSIFGCQLLAAAILIYQAQHGISIIDFSPIFNPFLILGVAIFIVLMCILISIRISNIVINGFWALLFAFIFSLGNIIVMDTVFDGSKPYSVSGRLLGSKRKDVDKLILMEPMHNEFLSFSTSIAQVESLPNGSLVEVSVMKGLFGIPWTYPSTVKQSVPAGSNNGSSPSPK